MDAFEMFLSLRESISSDPKIVHNLLLYSYNWWGELNYRGLLKRLGEGTQNVVFEMGSVKHNSNLEFLATREKKDFTDFPSLAKEDNNRYIKQLLSLQSKGVAVPRICGGVGVKANGKFSRYFLLVEDFTKKGTVQFTEGTSGMIEGLLAGSPIAYDFDTHYVSDPERDYFSEENLLIVEGERVYFQ